MILYQQHNSSIPYNYDVMVYDNFEYVPHLHRDPELVCVLEGEVLAHVEERTELLRAGELALILPNQAHSFETPQFSRAKVIVFAEEYVREFRNLLGKNEGKTSAFSMAEEDRSFLLRKTEPETPDRMDLCASLALACGAYLKQKRAEGLLPRKENGDLIHQILTYISDHYTENVTLTAMAEALGYEPHYLSRCFHRAFRKNFKQMVNEYRLQHARRLLSEAKGDLSLIDVAFASGFQSVRNFNRVYREAEGCQPRQQKTSAATVN